MKARVGRVRHKNTPRAGMNVSSKFGRHRRARRCRKTCGVCQREAMSTPIANNVLGCDGGQCAKLRVSSAQNVVGFDQVGQSPCPEALSGQDFESIRQRAERQSTARARSGGVEYGNERRGRLILAARGGEQDVVKSVAHVAGKLRGRQTNIQPRARGKKENFNCPRPSNSQEGSKGQKLM